MDAIIDLFYLLTFYYYYSYKDYSDTRTQNVAGALYTSRCRKQGIGQMSVTQQHSKASVILKRRIEQQRLQIAPECQIMTTEI